MAKIRMGVDEAGRGCVLGPLVVAIVAAMPSDLRRFADWRVRDSKKVPPAEREDLAARIRERCWTEISVCTPDEIDAAVADRAITLNGLELMRMGQLLRQGLDAHADHAPSATIDAIGRNGAAISAKLRALSRWPAEHPLVARPFADASDIAVAAASLIAKTERDRRLAEIAATLGEDFGCGYPHDAKTVAHLARCTPGASHVRWSWSTARRAITAADERAV
jgi:ribonuclease HII